MNSLGELQYARPEAFSENHFASVVLKSCVSSSVIFFNVTYDNNVAHKLADYFSIENVVSLYLYIEYAEYNSEGITSSRVKYMLPGRDGTVYTTFTYTVVSPHTRTSKTKEDSVILLYNLKSDMTDMAEKENVFMQSSASQDQNDEVSGQLLKQLCQPCSNNGRKRTAAVFCTTCKEFQCTECSNVHNTFTFMKSHKLVDANASREEPVLYNMDGLDRCEKHEKLVKFFCKDDKKLCCSTCAIIEHRKCNHVDEIQNMDIKERSGDIALKVEISKLKERSTAAVKHLADGEKQMQYQLQNVLGRLTAIRTSVNKKLDDFEENIKKQASSLSEIKATEYGQHRSKCGETISVLGRDLEILDAARRHGTPEQQFITQQRVEESLERTRKKSSEEMSELECTEICLELSQTLESLLDSTEKLGALKTNTSKIKIDSIVEGRPVKLREIMSIGLQKSEGDTGEPRYSGLDFLSNGRLVAVDNENDKCVILSEKFEQLGSCKLSNKPLGVVTMSKDEVAITSGKQMYFHRVSNCNEITHTKTVKLTSQYDFICMKNNDHFVVGTYDEKKPVRIVSLSGEEEDFNIDFPAKKYDINESSCTYIKNSDKVVLTDYDGHTVYIYYVKDKTSVVVKDDQIRNPNGVAIGPFDSIFVCSERTNSVVQISQTGKILSSHKLDIKFPNRVCVSKDKTKLVVSGQRKLQLFCIDM